MRRIVITGGPGAGKTTVLRVLAQRGFVVVEEAARAILSAPGGLALRRDNPDGFARAILEAEIARYEAIPEASGFAFYDRGLGDLLSMPVLDSRLRDIIAVAMRTLRYDGPVFRAPAWRTFYHQDNERNQTWNEAQASDLAVTHAWRKAGYEVVDLPLASPVDRADFILAHS